MRTPRSEPTTLVLLALLFLNGCADRDRTNPLDPLNPATGGSPAGFRAVSGNLSVQLSWSPLEVPDLAGYEIARRGPQDPDFVVLTGTPLAPTIASYRDTLVQNDTTYAYRLRFVLNGGGSGGTSETSARPGTAILWIADASVDALHRYTPDGGQRIFSLFGLNNPVTVVVDPTNGRVWGASSFEGFVAQWEASGQLLGASGVADAPLGLSPVLGSDRTWVAEGRFGEVLLLGSDGTLYTRWQGFDSPTDVAFDEVGLRTWFVDRTGRRLVAYNLSGIALTDEALDYEPWKIELDPPHDGLWISSASHGVVEYRADDGTLRARADGLARPFTIAVDAGREEAWVVLAGGDQVICLDAAAQVRARLESLPAPSGVAFDPMRDEVWVTTLGGTDGDGSLWHFTRDGALLTRTRGLARPVAVALDVARP